MVGKNTPFVCGQRIIHIHGFYVYKVGGGENEIVHHTSPLMDSLAL